MGWCGESAREAEELFGAVGRLGVKREDRGSSLNRNSLWRGVGFLFDRADCLET